jgi:hypothetical protein
VAQRRGSCEMLGDLHVEALVAVRPRGPMGGGAKLQHASAQLLAVAGAALQQGLQEGDDKGLRGAGEGM